MMRYVWLLTAFLLAGDSFGQQPDNAARWAIISKATEACHQAFSDSKLAPLLGKVPIPHDGAVTEAMLQLNRKPNAAERDALHVYYAAELECRRASANAIAQVSPGDTAPQTKEGRDDTLLLSEGKLSFAEYNARQKQMRDAAEAALKNSISGGQQQSREAAEKNRIETESWHKQALATCGSDADCVKIVNRYRDDAIACGDGYQQACNSKVQDQAAVDRWNESRKTATSLASTILLTCTLVMTDGSQYEPVLRVDLKNSKVNGIDATITDAQFAWVAGGFHWIVNRYTGGMHISSADGAFSASGQCRTASQKQF